MHKHEPLLSKGDIAILVVCAALLIAIILSLQAGASA